MQQQIHLVWPIAAALAMVDVVSSCIHTSHFSNRLRSATNHSAHSWHRHSSGELLHPSQHHWTDHRPAFAVQTYSSDRQYAC